MPFLVLFLWLVFLLPVLYELALVLEGRPVRRRRRRPYGRPSC